MSPQCSTLEEDRRRLRRPAATSAADRLPEPGLEDYMLRSETTPRSIGYKWERVIVQNNSRLIGVAVRVSATGERLVAMTYPDYR